MRLRHTPREMWRKDVSNQFVSNFAVQCALFGQDPRNRIGLDCGVSPPRMLQIHNDRQMDGSLASKEGDI